MKKYCFLPARRKSTRLKDKMLISIEGVTMVVRSYLNALHMDIFDEVVVVTDDLSIADEINAVGGKVILTPQEGILNGTSRIAIALEKFEHLEEDLIVNLQADEPFLEKHVVEKVLLAFEENPYLKMATASVSLDEKELFEPSLVKCVTNIHRYALYFSRSPIPALFSSQNRVLYERHLGIYAYKAKFLKEYVSLEDTPLQKAENLEQLKVLEHGIPLKVVFTESCSFGIDVEKDIEKAIERVLHG